MTTNRFISGGLLQEGYGAFELAAQEFSAVSSEGNWQVPRPTIVDLAGIALQHNVGVKSTERGMAFSGKQIEDITAFAGARGVVAVKTSQGSQQYPGIILRDARHVAVLTAERDSNFNELTHALLENEYITQRRDIVDHVKQGVAPSLGGHGLVAAAYIGSPQNAHDVVHNLSHNNFGSSFAKEGYRDFVGLKQVRSSVLPIGKTVLFLSEATEFPKEESLLGAKLGANELNVAFTVAATHTKGQKYDIRRNMEAMTRS